MNLLIGSLVASFSEVSRLRRWADCRTAVAFALILVSGIPNHCVCGNTAPALQIQLELGGVSMAKAVPVKFCDAVKLAVAANPKCDAAILREALSVERKDLALLAGRLTGAAIEGLGPEPSVTAVVLLVRLAVELHPGSMLAIVRAAVRATPASMAPAIVRAAVAAAKQPTRETVREVVDAAMRARTAARDEPDGKNVLEPEDGKSVVPPEDGKNVVPPEDGKDVPPLEEAANAGVNDLDTAFQNALEHGGPHAIPPLPPRDPHKSLVPSL